MSMTRRTGSTPKMVETERPNFATGTTRDPRVLRPGLEEAHRPGTGLYIEQGIGVGRIFSLSTARAYVIGREGADIELEDEKVSRRHAEICVYGPEGCVVLRDLASTNGTYVNGCRVPEKTNLKHNDLIRVGSTMLEFTNGRGVPIPRL